MGSFIKDVNSKFDPKSMKLAADDSQNIIEITAPEASLSKFLSKNPISQCKTLENDEKCFKSLNLLKFKVNHPGFENKLYTIPMEISKLIVKYQTKVIIVPQVKFDVLVEIVKYLKHYNGYYDKNKKKSLELLKNGGGIDSSINSGINTNDEDFDKEYLTNLVGNGLLCDVYKACMSNALDIGPLKSKTGFKLAGIQLVMLFGLGQGNRHNENNDNSDDNDNDSNEEKDLDGESGDDEYPYSYDYHIDDELDDMDQVIDMDNDNDVYDDDIDDDCDDDIHNDDIHDDEVPHEVISLMSLYLGY